MLDNKSNLARLALVEAFRRGELTFKQMERKAERLSKKASEKPKNKPKRKTP